MERVKHLGQKYIYLEKERRVKILFVTFLLEKTKQRVVISVLSVLASTHDLSTYNSIIEQ